MTKSIREEIYRVIDEDMPCMDADEFYISEATDKICQLIAKRIELIVDDAYDPMFADYKYPVERAKDLLNELTKEE